MLKINRKLSHKGFSLIELMVAAAILSLAIFGIFQAYSTGFLGMFDSRDRTVATNYVQEKMEELKNADFDTVITDDDESLGIIGDIKFSRNVDVKYIDGSTNLIVAGPTNLKRVTTTVNWSDRNGVAKKVESSVLLQNTQFTPGDAARISLYANPYNVVLPVTSSTTIIAVIKDNSGNTIINWDGSDVTFTIISEVSPEGVSLGAGVLGSLSAYTVTPVKGKASVIFTSSVAEEEGTVTIEASVTTSDGLNTFTDTIDIDVTWGAVKIELIPNPSSILANSTSQSIITATIQNAAGGTVDDGNHDVTFTVAGEGTLIGSNPVTSTLGIATITLQSTITAGIATVTASSPQLLSDSCDVQTSGVPAGITIIASPDTIYNDDTSTLTIKIVDINGVPVAPVGTIRVDLSLTSGSILPDAEGNTVTVYFNSVSSQTRTFIPNNDYEGTVKITADDYDGILSSDSVDINVLLKLVATKIELDANPPTIFIDGGAEGTSIITATIKDDEGNTVHNYDGEIDFTILSVLGGTLSGINPFGPNTVVCENGVATIKLYSGSIPGTCQVQAKVVSGSLITFTETISVGFYTTADHILLTAVPVHIPVGGGNEGTSKLTASIVDEGGTTVYNYKYNDDVAYVLFSFISGHDSTAKFKYVTQSNYSVPVFHGTASVDLISLSNAGVATLQAFSEGLPEPYSEILTIYIKKTLNLVTMPPPDPFTTWKGIDFYINALGGDITINRMKVTWSPPDSLELTNVTIDVDGNVSNNSGEMLNETDFDIEPITLSEGTISPINKVTLTFDSSIEGKDISIIFYPAEDELFCLEEYVINL